MSVQLMCGNIFNFDCFFKVSEFLDYKDVCSSEQVCQIWRSNFRNPSIWRAQSDREGFPLVIDLENKNRDVKNDFIVLQRMTLSARKMSILGEFVGMVPGISKEVFEKVFKDDPFATGVEQFGASIVNSIQGVLGAFLDREANKDIEVNKIRHNYTLIVEPHFIKRAYDENLVDDLTKDGDFEPECIKGANQELLIPYSLKNLQVLSRHPLKGAQPVTVDCSDVVKKSCNTVATQVNIYLMRKTPCVQSQFLKSDAQKELMYQRGFEMAPSRVRALFNAVEILRTGTCGDVEECMRNSPPLLIRTSDVMQKENETDAGLYGLMSSGRRGGPGGGDNYRIISISGMDDLALKNVAAVPVIPVVVQVPSST